MNNLSSIRRDPLSDPEIIQKALDAALAENRELREHRDELLARLREKPSNKLWILNLATLAIAILAIVVSLLVALG